MFKPESLAVLCCPETQQALKAAPPEVVRDLNSKIAAGILKNRRGQVVREAIDSALLREDGKFAYAIRNDIPVMLIDEAIPIF